MASYDKDLYKLTRKNVLAGQPKPWMQFAGGALQGAYQGWQQGKQQAAAGQLGAQLGLDPSMARNLDPSVLAGALLRSREGAVERGYRSDEADAQRRFMLEQGDLNRQSAYDIGEETRNAMAQREIIQQLGGIAKEFVGQRTTPIQESEIMRNTALAQKYAQDAGGSGNYTDEQIAARAAPFVGMGVPMSTARPIAEGSDDMYKTVLGTYERQKRYEAQNAMRMQIAAKLEQLKRDHDAGLVPLKIYEQDSANYRAMLSAGASIPTMWPSVEASIGDIGSAPVLGTGAPTNPLQVELDQIQDPAARAQAIEELRASGVDVTGLR